MWTGNKIKSRCHADTWIYEQLISHPQGNDDKTKIYHSTILLILINMEKTLLVKLSLSN